MAYLIETQISRHFYRIMSKAFEWTHSLLVVFDNLFEVFHFLLRNRPPKAVLQAQ